MRTFGGKGMLIGDRRGRHLPSVLRPEPLHVVVVEATVRISKSVGSLAHAPQRPLAPGVQRIARDPLHEVVIRPGEVRLNILTVRFQVLIREPDRGAVVQQLVGLHIMPVGDIPPLPVSRLDDGGGLELVRHLAQQVAGDKWNPKS